MAPNGEPATAGHQDKSGVSPSRLMRTHELGGMTGGIGEQGFYLANFACLMFYGTNMYLVQLHPVDLMPVEYLSKLH